MGFNSCKLSLSIYERPISLRNGCLPILLRPVLKRNVANSRRCGNIYLSRGGGEISRDFHFHSKLIEESIWKFQRGVYNSNIKSSFERKLFNTFYSSITRGSKRSRRSSLLLFCRFGSKGIASFCERIRRNFIHRGTLSWLNFTGTGSSDHATRQVNRARDKTSRRD